MGKYIDMKKMIMLFTVMLCVSFFGCTTGTTDLGYELAQQNKFTKTFKFDQNKDKLSKAVLAALKDREWKVDSVEPEIKASLKHRDYDAKLKIEVKDNFITFDSEGTTLGGEKFVPLRLIDFLRKSVEKHLKEANCPAK